MKTKTIKSLKKEVLVIEDSPAIDFYEINPRMLAFNMINGSIKIFKGNFTFLGRPDEIKEDDVADLVENKGKYYKNYSPIQGSVQGNITFTAIESFNSAIRKELFWVNPVVDKLHCEDCYDDWNEAQLNTFEKSRTLIFIKN